MRVSLEGERVMRQHTPGPWTVPWATGVVTDPELIAAAKERGLELPEPIERLTNAGQRVVLACEGEVRVAAVDSQTDFPRGKGDRVQCEERDANAVLIAASPDLLAAAEQARDALTAIMVEKATDWQARGVAALHALSQAVETATARRPE